MRRMCSKRLRAIIALMLLTACSLSEPVTRPPALPVEISSGVTPSPFIVTAAPPTVTHTPEMVAPPSATPVSGDNPAQARLLFYHVQRKEQGVTVFAFDPAHGEAQDVVTLPLEAGTDTFVSGTVLPSPRQNRLAVSVGSGEARQIYLVSNGEAHLIVSDEGKHEVGSWSPDGSRFLVFSTKESDRGCIQDTCYFDLYVIDAATGAAMRLTATADAEVDAVWSPDGGQIAFLRGCVDLSMDACGPDLYLVSADGSNERLLAEGWIANPVFLAPDLLAYIQYSGDSAGIYRIGTTSGMPQTIVANPDTTIAGMCGSPDGRMIAFIDVRGVCQVEECIRTLTLVAADGSGLRPIRTLDSWRYAWDWTPDGRLWLLLSIDDSRSRLEMYAADGTLIDERVID